MLTLRLLPRLGADVLHEAAQHERSPLIARYDDVVGVLRCGVHDSGRILRHGWMDFAGQATPPPLTE